MPSSTAWRAIWNAKSASSRIAPVFTIPAHFAYPTYAKAAIARRENLKRSADELRAQLEDAKMALGEAFDELKKVELLDERDQMREREAENAAEQAELDSIALMRVRSA